MKYTEEQKQDIIKLYMSGKSSLEIASKYNKKPSAICALLKRLDVELRSNKQNSKKYNIANESFFEAIDTEEKAYWLGFMYADGYVLTKDNTIGLSLSKNDYDHLEKFKKAIGSTHPIKVYRGNGYTNNDYCRLMLRSDKLKNDLISNGCIENKTSLIKFPNSIPKSLIHHFIRGYFDGDGCLTTYYNKANNSNVVAIKILGTENFLLSINDWCEDCLGYRVKSLYKRKKDSLVFNLEIQGKKRAIPFLELIYKDATIYLDRKKEKYDSLINTTIVEPNGNIGC